MYKKLIVSGCSFTSGNGWAGFLAEKYNLELVNLSWPGAGNKHMSDSLIVYLEQNKCDINEVLIGIMWSGIERYHWTISFPDLRYGKYQKYHYTDNIFLVFPQEILGDNGMNKEMMVHDPDLSMIELAYYRGKDARRLDGLLSMIHLNSYLNSKGYTFFQTHFFDPDGDETQDRYMSGTRYTDAYDKFGLSRPSTGMLNLTPSQYLGNWAVAHDHTVLPNDYHPTTQGHKLWTDTVLIPQLIQQKLLPDG